MLALAWTNMDNSSSNIDVIKLCIHNDLNTRVEFALNECDTSIEWYRKHGGNAYVWSRTFEVISLVLGSLSPILILGFGYHWIQVVAATMGATSSILIGISKIMKFESDWRRFCISEQELVREKYQFVTKTGNYSKLADAEEALRLFASRVTRIKKLENDRWKVALDTEMAVEEEKGTIKSKSNHRTGA
jgi:hypothetical protein